MKAKMFKYGATIAIVTYSHNCGAEVHYYYGIPQIKVEPDDVPRVLRINVRQWAEIHGVEFKNDAAV